MFTREEKIRRLKSLSGKEMEVLFYFCQQMTDAEICEKLDFYPKTLNDRRTKIYKALGVDVSDKEKQNYLAQEYCPLIPAVIASEDALKRWRPIKSEENPNFPEDNQSRPRSVSFISVGVFLLVIGIVAYTSYTLGKGSAAVPSAATQVPVLTALPASAVQSPVLNPPLIDTSVPTALPTLVPTLAPTLTAAPPTPTEFAPPADGILFQDNFDNGLKAEWQQYSGQWIVSDGKLTQIYDHSNDYTDTYSWIGVENPAWKNYAVTLSIHIYQPLTESDQIALAVRDNPAGLKYIGFEINFWPRIYLSLISQGYSESSPIAGDNKDFTFPLNVDAEAEIRVQDDKYSLSVDGTKLQTISIPGYDSGGFRVGIYCRGYPRCPTIDNIKVTYLP